MTRFVLVAHQPLASALRQAAIHVHPERAGRIAAIDVAPADEPERVADAIAVAGRPGACLILVDAYGASPCNAALAAARQLESCRVVTGVNVPMLWRVLAQPDLPLDTLVARALSGAQQGIVVASGTAPQQQPPRGDPHDQVHRHDQQ